MKCKIEKIENGFIVTYLETWDDGEDRPVKMVFEEKQDPFNETEKPELDALRESLHEVKEKLGFHYSKHNKYNLKIEVEKNDDAV